MLRHFADEAVLGDDVRGVAQAFVVKDGKSSFQPVKTGIMGDVDIEVVDGLTQGQEIVTGSYKTLRTLKVDAVLKIDQKDKSKS